MPQVVPFSPLAKRRPPDPETRVSLLKMIDHIQVLALTQPTLIGALDELVQELMRNSN